MINERSELIIELIQGGIFMPYKSSKTTRPTVTGGKGVVAAGHYLASAAGIKMFAKGGNAIDAGVAAGFALTVLKPVENSMGGECPILVYSPRDKKVFAISGQGPAPKKATADWFKQNNVGLIPGDGYLGAAVPSLFASYCTALLKFGTLTLSDALGPALEIAENGYPIYGGLCNAIKNNHKKYTEEWPSTGEVFIPGGKVLETGQILKQLALTNTFKRLVEAERAHASEGREAAIEAAIRYYYDEIADDILEFTYSFPVKDASGSFRTPLIEKEDFANYKTLVEEPVSCRYRDTAVYKCGPWTQGPVFLQQLKLLEHFDLSKMDHNSAEYIHTVTECAKLAFADREKYYGDPLFTNVPLDRLLSDEYNDARYKLIDPLKANNNKMWEHDENGFDISKSHVGDTTHLDSIDSDGFMMSATPSGAWIQSSPVIPKLGFPLGTRSQLFNLTPSHPNCIEPGKRPRTTLTPSLVFKNDKPWMVCGTPGGDCQDQWTLQFFLNVVDFKMGLQEALDKPSFHTNHFINSFYPKNVVLGTVFAEESIGTEELIKLQEKGHTLSIGKNFNHGQVCAVKINHETGVVEGGASAKGDGQAYAAGW